MKTKIKTITAVCALGLAIELTTPAQAAKPAAPSNLTATAVSSVQIDLTWTDNSNNEAGIERSTDGVNWVLIFQTISNVVDFSNAGLTPNTRYFYRLRAWNVSGNSSYTSPVSAVTLAGEIASPYEAVRLNDSNPIISQSMFAAFGSETDGANINGPSLIRVPDWISRDNRPDATANYY